jgi:hypothetical protein
VKYTHSDMQELIQRSLEEPLAEEDLILVNNHLAVCPECAAYRYELAVLEERLPRALQTEYPTPYISRAELAQITYQHRQRTQRARLFDRFFTLAQQAAFATAGVAMVAALAILAAQFASRNASDQPQVESTAVAAVQPESFPLPAAAPAVGSGEAYNSENFSIQIQVPQEWQMVQQDSQAEVFSGDTGFVKIATLPIQSDSLDQACAAEAASQPDLYGESPQINRVTVQEFQACLIIGDPDDETETGESELATVANALVVEDTRREPEERFWIMAADPENFKMLASSLQILPEGEEPVLAAEPPQEVQPAATATPTPLPPGLAVTAVELEPEVKVKITGTRTSIGDDECIKSELHLGEKALEWWPRDNCAVMLADGKWEIVVRLGELNPSASIDPKGQNRFKIYWPGDPDIYQWAYYPQVWAGLTLEEYAVVENEVDSPLTSGDDFRKRIPNAVFEKHAELRSPTQKQSLDEINAALEPFGYRLEAPFHRLYKNDELLKGDVTNFYPITMNASETDFLLRLEGSGSYLLTKDGLVEWDSSRSLSTWPVFAKNDLITLQAEEDNSAVNVLKNGKVIFTQALTFTIEAPVHFLQSYRGQWVLETNETVIIDGKDLREANGYSEVFGWQTLDGRPFYFFIKDGKVGLSYNGQVLPVLYEQVIHGLCCDLTAFNPEGSERMVWFYALKEGVWHYVELGKMY